MLPIREEDVSEGLAGSQWSPSCIARRRRPEEGGNSIGRERGTRGINESSRRVPVPVSRPGLPLRESGSIGIIINSFIIF